MTAVAIKSLDRDVRAQKPREREPVPKREFAKFVERERQSPKHAVRQLLEERGPAERHALHDLLRQIPPSEMPHGGIPEAIATEVSVVIDLPDQLQQNFAMAPIAVEDELSDGIPVAIEGGMRPKKKVDEEAITMAVPIPEALRELMHARTEIQLPIVGGDAMAKTVQMIPDAVPVLPELAAALASGSGEIPLTPLEQAIADLLSDRDDQPSDSPTMSPLIPEVRLLSFEHADAPVPVAQIAREQAELPEQTNPSHVHLVIDDGAERVVVTVAVRGNEVNVALRGQDDATTAALARNAGSLDHAMRARGLDLASLMTGRDPDSQHGRPGREQQARDRDGTQKFSLEEVA